MASLLVDSILATYISSLLVDSNQATYISSLLVDSSLAMFIARYRVHSKQTKCINWSNAGAMLCYRRNYSRLPFSFDKDIIDEI